MIPPHEARKTTAIYKSLETGSKGISSEIANQLKVDSLDGKGHKNTDVGLDNSRLMHMTILD